MGGEQARLGKRKKGMDTRRNFREVRKIWEKDFGDMDRFIGDEDDGRRGKKVNLDEDGSGDREFKEVGMIEVREDREEVRGVRGARGL